MPRDTFANVVKIMVFPAINNIFGQIVKIMVFLDGNDNIWLPNTNKNLFYKNHFMFCAERYVCQYCQNNGVPGVP